MVHLRFRHRSFPGTGKTKRFRPIVNNYPPSHSPGNQTVQVIHSNEQLLTTKEGTCRHSIPCPGLVRRFGTEKAGGPCGPPQKAGGNSTLAQDVRPREGHGTGCVSAD
uniref:(northern house mosquito) hypothetical protein n=1 Tax=Culex pipiens TaxID=7175 RepID=A0A8D8KYH3_CULPI